MTQSTTMATQLPATLAMAAGIPASMAQFLPAQGFLPAFHSLMAQSGQHLGLQMPPMASTSNTIMDKVIFLKYLIVAYCGIMIKDNLFD